MDILAGQHTFQQQHLGSLDAAMQSVTGDIIEHSQSSSLRHWASSYPNALPGVFAQSTQGLLSLQHSQHHGVEKHLAVERSGSNIPTLIDDQRHVDAPHPSQTSLAYAAAKASLAKRQRPAQQAPMSKPDSQVSQHQTASPQTEPFLQPGLQHQQPVAQHIEQHSSISQQRISRQPLHAHALNEVEDQQGESQPPQVLRRRPRSRLRLTQGGVAKGIMSLVKHRSGRISPDRADLLPSKQRSVASHQRGLGDDGGQTSQSNEDVSGRHLKLNTIGLEPLMPDIRPDVRLSAAARPLAKAHPSVMKMLSNSLQQVEACTAQLEQQRIQQQQLKTSVKAMTAETAAMLDQAILVAVGAQQHGDVLQQRYS